VNDPLIAENLACQYGDDLIVDGADLALQPSSITALLGQSGAGKSTLLRMLAGLERPRSGTVRLGRSVLSSPNMMVRPEERRIGLIFQDFALFPHLNAIENVRFGLASVSKIEGQSIAADWLGKLGLADRKDAFPHQLSGGEQQRVAIARALAPEPIAILMDEPFSGLDPSLRQDVRDVAVEAIKAVEIPALIVTHDAEEAMLLADKIAIMHQGKIIQHGLPDELYRSPSNATVAAALGPVSDVPGHVNGQGLVDTPFGALSFPGGEKGRAYKVIIRPEAVTLGAGKGVNAEVVSSRRLRHVYQIELSAGGHRIAAWTSAPNAARTGDIVQVSLKQDGCFVFPED